MSTTGGADRGALFGLRGVVMSWGAQRVLDEVDLDLRPGELVRIKGANGAGKTTLLRVATGLIRPEDGSVSLDGLDPERDRRRFRARIGFLSAGDGGLYARLSSRRHLELCVDLAMIDRAARRTVIEDAIAAFELAGFVDRRVQRLSTGQRQRVRLALAHVHAPDVMLLDEPATSLDDDGLSLMYRQLDALRQRGGAAIWCAPSAGDADIAFDRRLSLERGRLSPE